MNASQLIRIGVASNSTNLTRVLKPLREVKLIKHISAQPYGKGKLEYIYMLSTKGATFVSQLPNVKRPIRFPKNSRPQLTWDRFHKLRTIDFFMMYDKHIEICNINSKVITYWDYTHDSKTRKPIPQARFEIPDGKHKSSVIPDLILILPPHDDPKIIFVEIAVTPDLTHIFDGIFGHKDLIESETIQETLGLDGNRDPGILYVFEDTKALEATCKKFRSIPILKNYSKNFLFSTFPQLQADIFGAETWVTANGVYINPMPVSELAT